MKKSDRDLESITLVTESESDVFSELVKLSGLLPGSDFQGARLTEVDFAGSDLSEFNFDHADLRRAKWERRKSDPKSLRFALRGAGMHEVAGSDFEALAGQVQSKKSRWAERFFAYQILVDNWGENSDTADVLLHLFKGDNGTYLPLCCFVYFWASYFNDHDSKSFCIGMANAGGSQLNMFKLNRLRTAYVDWKRYLQKITLKERYPGDLSLEKVNNLRLVAAFERDDGTVS
ncbi:pentapeptide repeat-containing protein [Ruegeria arenilitoris]|uniref:pentapeptide repeat-containing protein n=1 Tax=Ruegeria arenilitoris TaxID=1173585 RepID=UPI00147C1B4D|nr:pentapeptide repeat-containing protein [Ruegeria arenilitoris]